MVAAPNRLCSKSSNHANMRNTFYYCSLIAFNLAFLTSPVRGNQETCAVCDRQIQVDGQFAHDQTRARAPIQGAGPGDAAAFREEIYGANFTVTVSHLPAGKYTVVIGEAEMSFKNAGQRLFDVAVGDTRLATNFDIFAVA